MRPVALKQIAFIVDRTSVNPHAHRMMESVREVAGVHVLLASGSGDENESDVSSGSDIARRWSIPCFARLVLEAESWLISLFVKRIRSFGQRVDIKAVPLSGLHDQAYDLVVSLVEGELKQSRIPESTHGVVTLHYGIVEQGFAGPPGFWASHDGRGRSGAIALLNRHDGVGQVLMEAAYKTKRLWSLNRESTVRESMIDLATVLRSYATPGLPRTATATTGFSWRAPSLGDVLLYRLRTLRREMASLFRQRLRRQKQVFSVMVGRTSWENIDAANLHLVPNPPGRYLADPFVVSFEGKTVCFVEDYSWELDRGRIACIDLDTDEPELIGTAIEEPCHMSFPFVFEFDGDLYMIPETYEAGEISLYRCSDFPLGWTRVGTLMDEIEASDTMVFPWDGRWWMLTNLRPPGAVDFFSRLYLFSADSPVSSDWTPHPMNPIVNDSQGGRNGGLLRGKDGHLYRVGQRQGIDVYGASGAVYRIDELTTGHYAESQIKTLPSDLVEGQIGGHHLHHAAGWTALDVLRHRKP